jgi:hypothetical protein
MRLDNDILREIQQYQPIENNWLKLDDLLSEIWEAGTPEIYTKQLFELLERFPVDESDGVLWGVIHGLESIDNYEPKLLASIHRQPTEITTHMVKRIANTGDKILAGQSIADIYRLIQAHPKAPIVVKEIAQSYLQTSV